jgi:hypothetical protein
MVVGGLEARESSVTSRAQSRGRRRVMAIYRKAVESGGG